MNDQPGQRPCTACGGGYPAEAAFCPSCGVAAGSALPPLDAPLGPPPEPSGPPTVPSVSGTRLGAARIRMVAVAVGVVAVVAIVLTVGWHPPHTPTAAATTSAGRSPTPATHTASSITPTPSTKPSSAPPPASGGPNHGMVAIAPALYGQSGVDDVAGLLTRYFGAINNQYYQGWIDALVPGPGRDPQRWRELRSTHDDGITLFAVNPRPGGMAAAVAFTSHQDASLGPNRESCTRWSIAYDIVPYQGSLRIDIVNNLSVTSRTC